MHLLLNALRLVLIDLLLAGDNALVIALAVRALPKAQRRLGVIGGASGAVLLRVALTTFAARMLEIPYLQIVGGVFILWIALKVIMDASSPPEESRAPRRLWQAIWYIVVADITMSTDNILAIAGASHGNFLLILFGLAVSIPFIVVSSNLLAMVMDRFPALIYLGSAILGQVGGEMILTDPLVTHAWNPSETIRWAIEAGLAIAILIAGRRLARRRHLP